MSHNSRLNKLLIGGIDVLIYLACFFIAVFIRFGSSIPSSGWEAVLQMLPWFVIVFITLAVIYDLYSEYTKYDEIIVSIGCLLIVAMLTEIALSFLFRQFAFPRTIFLISAILQFILLSIWRYIVWRQALLIKEPRRAVIIGYSGEIRRLLGSINVNLSRGLKVVLEIRLNSKDHNFDDSWNKFLSTQMAEGIDFVIVCSSVGYFERSVIMEYCIESQKSLVLVPNTYEILLQNARLISAGDVPLVQLTGIFEKNTTRFVKRFMDICFAVLGLLISAPLMIIIALLIKLDSPGPIIYSQIRSGLRGKTFKLHKFRTMVKDAEKYTGPILSTEGDSRVTRVGKILRKTRLDEIPQLWNILRGDMSLVGPRPERPVFVEEFSKDLPEFKYRQQINGGLTGLAQVEGCYSTDPANKLTYDLIYAQNRSVIMDIVIILKTIKVMFMKGKAS